MSIDWSKAPEGATHYCSVRKTWLKNDENDMWLSWMPYGRTHEKPLIGWCFCHEPDGSSLTAKAWTGEGLPPVGTVCEFRVEENDWRLCEVIAHKDQMAICWIHCNAVLTTGGHSVRPVRTPEQIAEDERRNAVSLLAGLLAGHDQYVAQRDTDMAAYLYDAGYRKQVTQ